MTFGLYYDISLAHYNIVGQNPYMPDSEQSVHSVRQAFSVFQLQTEKMQTVQHIKYTLLFSLTH